MIDSSSYSIEEHCHRFAVWTAATAVRRGFSGRTEQISKAIDASGLRLFACADPSERPTNARQLDELHKDWAESIQSSLQAQGVSCSYGQAAKIIAVYLKTTVVLSGHEFARLIHPPIDRVLLQALARDPRFAANYRKLWRRTNWTKLDKAQYFRLIQTLRTNGLDRPGFWQIERYWNTPK